MSTNFILCYNQPTLKNRIKKFEKIFKIPKFEIHDSKLHRTIVNTKYGRSSIIHVSDLIPGGIHTRIELNIYQIYLLEHQNGLVETIIYNKNNLIYKNCDGENRYKLGYKIKKLKLRKDFLEEKERENELLNIIKCRDVYNLIMSYNKIPVIYYDAINNLFKNRIGGYESRLLDRYNYKFIYCYYKFTYCYDYDNKSVKMYRHNDKYYYLSVETNGHKRKIFCYKYNYENNELLQQGFI